MKKYEAPSMKELVLDTHDIITSSVIAWVDEDGNVIDDYLSEQSEITLPGDWVNP